MKTTIKTSTDSRRIKKSFNKNCNGFWGTKGKGSVTFHNMFSKCNWKTKKHIMQYMLLNK